jgi:hypothetical protein
MKRIRKFESFTKTHRMPTKVSEDEWRKKFDHGRELFTEKETKFFKQLIEENKGGSSHISLYNIQPKDVSLTIYSDNIELYKLKDDWYLIYVGNDDYYYEDEEDGDGEAEKFYICDEWDEVLGYLESIDLILPL